MANKCDIKGCTENATSLCAAIGCNNKTCDMHTHVVSGKNNKSIFVCEDCYKKGKI
jgi:hypothetical protein